MDDQVNIADAYRQLGRIYKDWGKSEQAINYFQQSLDLYQQLGKNKNVAICYRQLASCQCLLANHHLDSTKIVDLLAEAEKNLCQAREINTAGEYQENLAYNYTTLGLLYSQRLRLLPNQDISILEKAALVEEYYSRGLTYFDELGQTVNKAEESLDMARAYLEIEALENLNYSEEIAQKCLQIFQEYNRQKLEASAHKLLGEIYLKRTQKNQPGAETMAIQFLAESLQIYRDLDLQEKALEVEKLINISKK
ncbi:signal transduction protein [Nostoc commune NIES-4072]|uniref:Signal transduction protein n=1 Tax=Nostoc commune NIES-4072 TaxID=2005467 RepID=A0A2R5FQY1_NOSCO|nr:signal transduction protein [Nostoc commune NIES-4072]